MKGGEGLGTEIVDGPRKIDDEVAWIEVVAVGEVERFFKGEPLENVVTRKMLATMT